MSLRKKLIVAGLILVGLIGAHIFTTQAVGPGTPNYWCLSNNALNPCSSSWTLSSSSISGVFVPYSGATANVNLGDNNLSANNVTTKATNVVSAATTTFLTVNSTRLQNITGSATQTIQLPDATTLSIGTIFDINNNSSQSITVNDGGGSFLATVVAGGWVRATVIANVTVAGAWDIHSLIPVAGSWGTTKLSVGGTNTSTVTGDGTASYIPNIQTFHYFPTPAQLASGTNVGASTNVTDVGAWLNAVYLADDGVVSTTAVIFPVGQYASSSWLVPAVFGTQNHLIYFIGQPGNGTSLTYGSSTGVAVTLNDCDSNHKRGALQMGHMRIQGTTATTTNGGVTLIMAGGTNGACNTILDDLTLTGATYGVITATNTYMFSLQNSYLAGLYQALWQKPASNSGENMLYLNDKFVDPQGLAGGGIASATKYVYLDVGSTENTTFITPSIDDAQLYVESGNFNVIVEGPTFENSDPATYGTYDKFFIASSTATNFLMIGGTVMEDATSSSGAAIDHEGVCQANCQFRSVTAARNTGLNATTTTRFVGNAGGTGTAKIEFCDTKNTNSAFSAVGPLGTNFPSTNNGCLYSINNGYSVGWDYGTGTNQSVFRGGNNGVDITVTGNIGGNGVSVSNYFSGAGTTVQGSSTVDVGGTFGCRTATFNVSTTASGLEAAAQGACTYVFTGSSNATITLPIAASTTNRMMWFKNRGTANLSIAATATTTDGIWLIATNASSAAYTLIPGSSTLMQSDGTYFLQLNK